MYTHKPDALAHEGWRERAALHQTGYGIIHRKGKPINQKGSNTGHATMPSHAKAVASC